MGDENKGKSKSAETSAGEAGKVLSAPVPKTSPASKDSDVVRIQVAPNRFVDVDKKMVKKLEMPRPYEPLDIIG